MRIPAEPEVGTRGSGTGQSHKQKKELTGSRNGMWLSAQLDPGALPKMLRTRLLPSLLCFPPLGFLLSGF